MRACWSNLLLGGEFGVLSRALGRCARAVCSGGVLGSVLGGVLGGVLSGVLGGVLGGVLAVVCTRVLLSFRARAFALNSIFSVRAFAWLAGNS